MNQNLTRTKKSPRQDKSNLLGKFQMRVIALFAFLLISMGTFAHGVQVGYVVLSNGYIRIFIEDWHGAQSVSSLQGNTINVTTTYGTTTVNQDVNVSGTANGVTWDHLPGAGSNIIILAKCAGNANNYNNWGYFDFAPAACGVPVSITINAGNTVVFEEACSNLYPVTVNATFAYVAPVITTTDVNVTSCSPVNVNFTSTALSSCDQHPTTTYSVPSGSLFSVGNTPVTATVTDDKGNTASSTFHVIVTAPPISIVSPGNIAATNTPGQCGANITYPAATASGSPSPTISYSMPSGSFFPVGTTTVIVTASNSCTTATSSFTVTITSTDIPYFVTSITGTKTVSIPNGHTPVSSWSPYVYNFADPLPAGAVVTGTDMAYSAVDQQWGGQGFNIQLYVSGTQIANTQILHNLQNFNINYTGSIPAYVYGGTNSFSMYFAGYPGWQAFLSNATLTIHYSITASSTTLSGITVNSDPGKCGAFIKLATPVTVSSCAGQSVTSNAPASSFFPIGHTIVTWTVTDVNNNSATITQDVAVLDINLPVITAPVSVTLACGNSTSPTSTGTATATDLCYPKILISYTDNVATPTSCGGTIIRTWKATAGNNVSIATQTITVTPAALPVMPAPADITVACGGLPASSTILFSNGLSGNCLINGTSNPSTFTATPLACGGNVTETWTATDNCGRSISAVTRIITVSPATLPVMTAPADVTVACGGLPASSTLSFSNGLGGNCLISGTSNPSTFTATPLACGGNVTETWSATDICNRVIASVSRVITVSAAALPVMTAPADITVACGGLPKSSTLSFSNGLGGNCLISGTSNLSTFTATPLACGGNVTETWTATDICNRVIASVSRVITVSPAALPVMIAPSAVTISVACGTLPVPSTLTFTNGLMDGCLINGTSNASTFVTTAGTCGGTLTEIWTATDLCGRPLASVSRTVTVSQTLGAVQNFVLYSGIGAVSNTGNSNVTGDVGSNLGAVSGFGSPSTLTGGSYSATTTTTQAKIDLLNLYIHLSNIPVTNTTHAAVFGSNETINAGVYTIGGAASMAGNLNLDAQGNAHAIFILKFDGAFSPAAGSSITLLNGASAANVFYIAEGAISIGATSSMKGTFIAHTGAATMAAGGDLEGRILSTVGAVSFGPGVAKLPAGFSAIPVICVNNCTNPIVGSAGNFALFTTAGAVSNTGSSGIIGNVGSGAGAITGFETPSTTLVGTTYNGDATTTQASNDLLAGYTTLVNTTTTNSSHAPAFGNETLTPGVYAIGAAGSLAGTLILDGQGDPNATFIFKFGGAFSVGAQSKIVLVNGTRHCNVYWIAEGAISIGTFSFIKGTLIAHNGANTMGANGNLEGSLFSTAGAIGFNTGVGYISYSLCTNPASAMPAMVRTMSLSKSIEMSVENKLAVYPNPAKGIITLAVTGDANMVTSVEILNVLGKVVYSSKHYQSTINLSNHAAGIYFVRVLMDSKIITTKIVLVK